MAVMLGAGASATAAVLEDLEAPGLITIGCAAAFVTGTSFAATAEAEGLDESGSALILLECTGAFTALT
jgi:hypothetical protein